MKKIFCLLLLVLSSKAFATAKVVGNGGDVVVCPNSVTMLDIYEAQVLRGYTFSLGLPTDSVNDKVLIALKRIQRVDPHRAQVIESWAEGFINGAKFVHDVELRDVNDSNQDFLPVGCHLEQIAIQNTAVLMEDPFYVVNADLWDRLDNDSKAVLTLHEAIFAASEDRWSSSEVRTFNSFGFTSHIDSLPQDKYYQEVFYSEFFHETVIGAPDSNGQWYFQQYNYAYNRFVIAFQEPLNRVLPNMKGFCVDEHHGRAATAKDLPQIQKTIAKFIGFTTLKDYATMDHRSVWISNGTPRPDLYNVYFTKIEKATYNAKTMGEVWCVSSKNPFELNDPFQPISP